LILSEHAQHIFKKVHLNAVRHYQDPAKRREGKSQNANLQNSSGLIPTSMKINALRDLGQGIDKLNLAVNRNSSLEEVYNIVHGQIHPNLFLAFNLKLKAE